MASETSMPFEDTQSAALDGLLSLSPHKHSVAPHLRHAHTAPGLMQSASRLKYVQKIFWLPANYISHFLFKLSVTSYVIKSYSMFPYKGSWYTRLKHIDYAQQPQSSSLKRRVQSGSQLHTLNGSMSNSSTGRKDNSLTILTDKFRQLLQSAKDGIVDLNEAASTLQVQKRRIYDITNVLEGIGLVEKKSKNTIQWKGVETELTSSARSEVAELQRACRLLSEEEKALDMRLEEIAATIRNLIESPITAHAAFITHEDMRKLDCMADQTICAIKAPSGTRLEVPDPDDSSDGQRRYQIILKNEVSSEPIDVYLVSHRDQTLKEPAAAPDGPIPDMGVGLDNRCVGQQDAILHDGGVMGDLATEIELCPIAENGLLKPTFTTDDMDYYLLYNNDGLAGLYADG